MKKTFFLLLLTFAAAVTLSQIRLAGNITVFKVSMAVCLPIAAILILHRKVLAGFFFSRLELSLFLLVTWALASYFWAADKETVLYYSATLVGILGMFILTQILLMYCLRYGEPLRLYQALAKFILFAAVISSMTAVLEYMGLIHLPGSVFLKDPFRTAGIQGEVNFGAAFLSMSFPFCFATLPLRARAKHWALTSTAALLVAAAIVVTGSRMGILLLLINGVWLARNLRLVVSRTARRTTIVLAVLTVVLLGGLAFQEKVFVVQNTLDALADIRTGDLGGSLGERIELLDAGWRGMLDFLPFGMGYQNFEYHVLTYASIPTAKSAHNTYLQLAAELGPVGLVLFLVFLAGLLRCWARAKGLFGEEREGVLLHRVFRQSLLIACVAFLLLTDYYAHLFWLLAGVVLAGYKYEVRLKGYTAEAH
jgi:O-antigen ligase